MFECCRTGRGVVSFTCATDDKGLTLVPTPEGTLAGAVRGVVIALPGGVAEKEDGCRSTQSSTVGVSGVEEVVTAVRAVLEVTFEAGEGELAVKSESVTGNEEEEEDEGGVLCRRGSGRSLSGLGTSSLICFSISARDMGWMGGTLLSCFNSAASPPPRVWCSVGSDWENRDSRFAPLLLGGSLVPLASAVPLLSRVRYSGRKSCLGARGCSGGTTSLSGPTEALEPCLPAAWLALLLLEEEDGGCFLLPAATLGA